MCIYPAFPPNIATLICPFTLRDKIVWYQTHGNLVTPKMLTFKTLQDKNQREGAMIYFWKDQSDQSDLSDIARSNRIVWADPTAYTVSYPVRKLPPFQFLCVWVSAEKCPKCDAPPSLITFWAGQEWEEKWAGLYSTIERNQIDFGWQWL